jgi:hypothetical protein
MKTFIVQCRYRRNEMFLMIDCNTIGQAIIEAGRYLHELEPSAVFDVYAVQETDIQIVLEDLILN